MRLAEVEISVGGRKRARQLARPGLNERQGSEAVITSKHFMEQAGARNRPTLDQLAPETMPACVHYTRTNNATALWVESLNC